MKKIFFLVVVFLSFNQAFSDTPPPPPPPTPPPGLPVDSGIVVLFLIAIIFGFYISRKKYIKKSSL